MSTGLPAPDTSFTARCVIEETVAERVADALSEARDPAAMAVARFAAGAGREEITAYYGVRPDAHAIAAIIAAALPAGATIPRLRFDTVGAQDWVTRSQQRLTPVRAGDFVVHGSHDRARRAHHARAVEIDAGQAFGTAHHGTTKGCLMALSDLARRGAPGRVLDLGTGSGILAIAAAKAGARCVVATDMDPVAVAVARGNAQRNRMRSRVSFLLASGLSHPRFRRAGGFDLILANVLARPLAELAPALARQTTAGGRLVLSGLTPDQARPAAARYRSVGFVLRRSSVVDGWATLVLARRSSRRHASQAARRRSRRWARSLGSISARSKATSSMRQGSRTFGAPRRWAQLSETWPVRRSNCLLPYRSSQRPNPRS